MKTNTIVNVQIPANVCLNILFFDKFITIFQFIILFVFTKRCNMFQSTICIAFEYFIIVLLKVMKQKCKNIAKHPAIGCGTLANGCGMDREGVI